MIVCLADTLTKPGKVCKIWRIIHGCAEIPDLFRVLKKLSLFKDCPLYNKQNNTWVLGNTRFISRVEHDISRVSAVRYHVQHEK